jgi:hypothetical protein
MEPDTSPLRAKHIEEFVENVGPELRRLRANGGDAMVVLSASVMQQDYLRFCDVLRQIAVGEIALDQVVVRCREALTISILPPLTGKPDVDARQHLDVAMSILGAVFGEDEANAIFFGAHHV